MVRVAFALCLVGMAALPVRAAEHMVTVGDNFFDPAQLTVEAGDTVIWTNQGNNLHNVQFDDRPLRCANGCDETGGDGDLSRANWSFRLTFEDPGENPYYCELHGAPGGLRMAGNVTVEAAQEPPPTGQDINFGHTGSWFNAEQDGQGFSLEVVPATQQGDPDQLTAYWFTFAPAEAARLSKQGVEDQRWFIGLGPIEGSEAVMEVFQVTGGVFDDPAMTTPNSIGSATFRAESCTAGGISYSLDLDGDGMEETAGDIALARLTPDVLCQDMAGAR